MLNFISNYLFLFEFTFYKISLLGFHKFKRVFCKSRNYILTRIFAEWFGLIPSRVLYIFSDTLQFLFYHVIRYLKNVALDNLRKAFLGKTDKEIRNIAWKSYQNLTEIMLESFNGMFVSEKSKRKRMKVINGEVCDSYTEQGKSAIYLTGRCAN